MLRKLQRVLVRPWTCQHVLMLVYDIFLAVLLVDNLVRLTLALRADRMTAKQIERKAIAAVPRKPEHAAEVALDLLLVREVRILDLVEEAVLAEIAEMFENGFGE